MDNQSFTVHQIRIACLLSTADEQWRAGVMSMSGFARYSAYLSTAAVDTVKLLYEAECPVHKAG